MDMTQYICEQGVEETIRQIATKGPFSILADLGPGPGECKRIVAESSRAYNEVTVELTNGFIRRDFPIRERLEALLDSEDAGEGADIEGEDLRWLWIVVKDGPWRWRLRTYEGENANEAIEEETQERVRTALQPLTEEQRTTLWDEILVSETFEQWNERLSEEPQWPNTISYEA